MSVAPVYPAGVTGVVGGLPITKNLSAAFVDATSSLTLFNKPSIDGIIQMFPERDRLMQQFLDQFIGMSAPVASGADVWYRTYMDPQFGIMYADAHGAAAGPGLSVTITLAAGSYTNGAAAAFENYVYIIRSGNTVMECFCRPGGVNDTVANAWTVTLFPTDLTNTIPAQLQGEVVQCLFSQVAEGNTVHADSGRFVPAYTMKHNVALRSPQGVSITDLAAFSNESYMPEGQIQMASGQMVQTRYWWNVEIHAAIQGWLREDLMQKWIQTGDGLATDANGRLATIGIKSWIETLSGNVFTWNGVSISDAEVTNWINSMAANYENVREYTIVAGQTLRDAIYRWIKGPHFTGQIITADQKMMDLDFMKFKWKNITFYIPEFVISEMDNPYGLGALGYGSMGFIIPVGKTSTTDSTGVQRPFLAWKYLGNNQTMFPGAPQGKRTYTWSGPGSFGGRLGALPSLGAGAVTGDHYVPVLDEKATLYCTWKEGSDFVKAYMFGMITL